MNRVQNLDGLRGVAALTVVIFHFIGSFYPILLQLNIDNPNKYIEFIAKSPLSVFYNGLFSVSIFFVLSGFVLSYKFLITENIETIISAAFKRYIRLAIPVTFSILLIYLFSKVNPQNVYSTIRYPSISNALCNGLIECFLAPSNKYNPVVWTMYYELSGSFLVFGFCLIFSKRRNRIWGYLFTMLFFWGQHYFSFFAGVLLCDLYVTYGNYIKFRSIKLLLLSIALFLGSYPALFDQKTISTTIYSFMSFNSPKEIYIIYHSLGATFLIMVLMNSNKMSRFFSLKAFAFLGKISFSMYLLHMIVFQYFSRYFLDFIRIEYIPSPVISKIIAFVVSFILIIISSIFMMKFVDQPGIKLANLVYDRLFKGFDRNSIVELEFKKIRYYFIIKYNKVLMYMKR